MTLIVFGQLCASVCPGPHWFSSWLRMPIVGRRKVWSDGSGLTTHPSLRDSLWFLEETTGLEVFFDDDIGYSSEHKRYVLCVCGTGHVRVDLLDVCF